MDHDLELFIPILEILEIEVFNILYEPGNVGKRIFSNFSYPGNIGNRVFLIPWSPGNIRNWIFLIFWSPGNIGNRVFLIAWYPGNAGGGRAEAGGRLQGLCCAALDYFWNMFPGISGYPGNIGNMSFLGFGDFSKKDARQNFTQNGPIFMPRSLI